MTTKLDYSLFYLEAKKKLNEAYELLKKHKYEEAALLLDDTVAEVRLMKIAVKSHVE